MFSPVFFFGGGWVLLAPPLLLTHIFWGAQNLPELADGAQFAGQAKVYDLNVP